MAELPNQTAQEFQLPVSKSIPPAAALDWSAILGLLPSTREESEAPPAHTPDLQLGQSIPPPCADHPTSGFDNPVPRFCQEPLSNPENPANSVYRMKLLLIDGHYYVYRSFFAIQNLSNSRGEPTNAIFGFTKTLRLMVKHLRPEFGAVFWDEGVPQRRVELQPGYKETRKEMPRPMVPQLDYIQKLTPLLGFKNVSLPDTEADDLMGCYAIAAAKRNMEVVLATNDKDLFQLVGPAVKIYTTAKADLASPKDAFALLGEAEVTLKWAVPPHLIGDVLAIAGDSVDNIPGAGIGRKAAAGLIREHGNLEQLLANLDKVKSLAAREKLRTAHKQILQNRRMVELDCAMDLPVPIDDLVIEPDYPALLRALEQCEFKSLLQEVRDEAARAGASEQSELKL
jgi:5'-3' exonuclease